MNTVMFVLVLGAYVNDSFVVKPVQAFETMLQCTEASSRVVDKFFVHCMGVEDKQPESTTEKTPS